MLINKLIKQALDEDLGLEGEQGDITSNFTIPKNRQIKFQIKNREPIVLCGADIVLKIFEAVEKRLKIKSLNLKINYSDGDYLPKNSIIIEGSGNARVVFAAERVALNLMQHLSGVATITRQYVEKIKGTKAVILDTRKTLLGLRNLQKYAVKVGGASNHRMALYDGILIKDNHIAAAGSINEAVKMVRENLKKLDKKMSIEVECDNLEQVAEALSAKVDVIMLDNMTAEQIKKAVKLINGKAKVEVSGGVNLESVLEIAKSDVDYISIGAITHSVKAVDIGLDVI